MNTGYRFRLEGQVTLEKYTQQSTRRLQIQAFNTQGLPVGTCETNPGDVFNMALALRYPSDVHLTIKPVEEIFEGGSNHVCRHHLTIGDWASDQQHFAIHACIEVPKSLWHGWWPQQISVSGCIRDADSSNGTAGLYAIELYEVDRTACWWPLIQLWWKTLVDQQYTNEPPISDERLRPAPLRPQARQDEPPLSENSSEIELSGNPSLLPDAIAQQLKQLTILSEIEPWTLFPGSFFRASPVAETISDSHGNFKCRFDWHRVHERQGRRSDQFLPDLIIKASPMAEDGKTSLYLDPYTSIQWHELHNHARLNLDLNAEHTLHIPHRRHERPHGTSVYISRVGNDHIHTINQTTGLYSKGYLNNIAYGGNLRIHAKFGRNITTKTPARYYRLCYVKKGCRKLTILDAPLTDLRIHNDTQRAESHYLGPHLIGRTPNLYEIRNFDDYLWCNPDFIGVWQTRMITEGSGTYILRLEVFDEHGAKLTTNDNIGYRDATILKHRQRAETDGSELVITIDNTPPQQLQIDVPRVTRYEDAYMTVEILANHPGKRLHHWTLSASLDGQNKILSDSTSQDDQVFTVYEHITFDITQLVQPRKGVDYLLVPLTLTATPAIRNGEQLIYQQKIKKTVAIDMRACTSKHANATKNKATL